MDSQTQPEVPKPERKVVIARYWVDEAFKVPDGIDLENKKQVKDWEVKWNTLSIKMVDGTEIKVEGVGWLDDYEYWSFCNSCNCKSGPSPKRPQDATIEEASDWNLDEED